MALETDRVVAEWLARRTKQDASKITDISFAMIDNGGCETCGYETLGMEYKYDGKYQDYEIGTYGITPGEFVAECAAIQAELS